MIKNFSYPQIDDPDIQSKIFKKREFYYHQIKPREKMNTYEDIKNYREKICKSDFKLREQQAVMSNFFNPNTPYTGLLIMHGTGVGKTCTAISIAEQFKDQIKKYNTKIFFLTFGPNGRETIKTELLFCTGDTYLKNKEILDQMTYDEIEKEKKIAINNALQNYKILSYKSFYKKVLGEKIMNKDKDDLKSKYKRNEEGDIEREIINEKITNMNNSILIIDEAHNLTNNEFGNALKKIIKESENLRVLLLTATPMKNLADDIVDLLNFIRPIDDQIHRDKIFTAKSDSLMKIKPGGIEYLKQKSSGYVSFFRGNIPYTFAKKIDKGIIPNGLLFTPVIKCFMEVFQYDTYIKASKYIDDKLNKASSASANFVFPGLNKEKNDLIGYFSNDGINIVLSQINTDGDKLKQLINKKLFDGKLSKEVEENFLLINEKKNLSGYILKKQYLKCFSIKFYKALNRLNKLFVDKSDKKLGTVFVYSNLVNAGGIEIFAEVLLMNGYLEYNENYNNYNIKDDTIDYKTGIPFSEYKKKYKSSEFMPATFILITGSVDENGENIPEIKQKIIRDVYNNVNNIDGKYIKVCLGSKVMNEGITLENVKEIHILDVHYNLGKIDQVIGRGIRWCKHINSINDENKFPKVNVYRYVVAINDQNKNKLTKKEKMNSPLSTDEILYQKAELKYLVVKDIEHALKEVAVDCPLLLNGNMFPEEIEKYKGCAYPTLENIKQKKIICPALCDFRDCDFKCESKKLNDKYYDKNENTYKLNLKDIDYNTFNDNLAKFEIDSIKNKIKDLFRFNHVYLYSELLNEIKNSYLSHQKDLFEEYFLDQALEDMMPKNENDFNNFKDNIYDKYNRPGYIIQRDKYYIFQPFDENEDVSMFYRQNIPIEYSNLVSINNYVKQKFGNIKIKTIKENKQNKDLINYDFTNALDYYQNRKENFIVGIIDKNFNKLASSEIDLFKIRQPLSFSNKKRGTGIPTLKGAVCSTSKDKEYLMNLIKKIPNINKNEINRIDKLTRELICNELKNKLLYLEKYSTTKDNNKVTYVMIPYNHPLYPFPYNLEDRIKYISDKINTIIGKNIDISIKKFNDPIKYTLTFPNNKFSESITNQLLILNCVLTKNEWQIIID